MEVVFDVVVVGVALEDETVRDVEVSVDVLVSVAVVVIDVDVAVMDTVVDGHRRGPAMLSHSEVHVEYMSCKWQPLSLSQKLKC